MNEHVIGRRVIGARLAFSFRFVCVCEREKRGKAVASVAVKGPSREKLSHIVKLFGRSFFFFSLSLSAPPHVKFINVFCVIFFHPSPHRVASDQVTSCIDIYIYFFFFLAEDEPTAADVRYADLR